MEPQSPQLPDIQLPDIPQALRDKAAQAPGLHELPHPDALWWRAEIVGKRKTLRHAGNWIAGVVAGICVLAIIAIGVLVSRFAPQQSIYVAAAFLLSVAAVVLGLLTPLAIRSARR